MVASLVQQCEDKRIFADERMESEPTINADETGAVHTKRLRVHDPSLRIDFVFDAGERGPKFGDKNFDHPTAALGGAKGEIIWQGEGIQHARIAGLRAP